MTGHLRGLDIVQFEPGPRPQRCISSPIVVIRLTSLVLVRLLGGQRAMAGRSLNRFERAIRV